MSSASKSAVAHGVGRESVPDGWMIHEQDQGREKRMLEETGRKALEDRIVADLSVTPAQAAAAIEDQWMSLAFGPAPLDVAGIAFDRCGDFVWVLENGALIATLPFPQGALPALPLPEPMPEDAEWEATAAQMEQDHEMALRSIG